MRIGYLDIAVGISGDMTLGALADAGVELSRLRQQLRGLPVTEWEITAEKVSKGGIQATKVTVTTTRSDGATDHRAHGQHASYTELRDVIAGADLPLDVVNSSLQVLDSIAQAEANVHGVSLDEVHFHELAGIDTLIDIVGSVIGLRMLEVEKLYCSALPVSHGFVDTAHGRLPVPPPAVAELLKGYPTVPVDINEETVTPTGAALATSLCEQVGMFPPMTVEQVGYGAGSKDFPGCPNVLRLWVGQSVGGDKSLIVDEVVMVEANVDDMSPELHPHVVAQIFAAGALDVWLTPIQMKKGRPAVKISALAAPSKAESVAGAILRESTTFGVRLTHSQRRCLNRETVTVTTRFGELSVKVGYLDGRVVTVAPEYEDCLRAAQKHGVPVKAVYSAALAAADELWEQPPD
ncbi:MAG: nickel pincer cofactor biosynthesis protein LarC [Armatimonadetes bacterium]|nr:nickel pincer cofactor biosynthesis protein LarC [Armatimonadota bacterium]